MSGLLRACLALGCAAIAAGSLHKARKALKALIWSRPESGRHRNGGPPVRTYITAGPLADRTSRPRSLGSAAPLSEGQPDALLRKLRAVLIPGGRKEIRRPRPAGGSADATFDVAAPGLSGALPERDRIYALGLLGPFAVHGLALKVSGVVFGSGKTGPKDVLLLVRSDLLFDLGYSLFWAGLLGAARGGPPRWAAVGLFHAATVLVMFVRTAAHQFFRQTGTTLDYPIIALWLPRLDQIRPMLAHGIPRPAWALLAAALLYATLGPCLLAKLFDRWRSRPESPAEVGYFHPQPLWLSLVGLAVGLLSLPPGPVPAGVGRSFARDPVVNVVLTALRRPAVHRRSARRPAATERPAAWLVRSVHTRRRSVVLVHLESTRASSVTPYNEALKTTPFLEKLAKDSLLVEQAYTTVPHTSKASVSANCGIVPDLAPEPTESSPDGLPVRGLAGLLKEEGYGTVFFQSSVENFDDFGQLARNFGYEEYYPLESMDTEGFERPNYFGCEDDVMLRPSEKWLTERGEGPFVAHYLTGTAHHDYRPPARYGRVRFADDELLDRYLNCVRYQDFFVRNLLQQYRDLGLYEDTIFVIYGDHGEGFGEHGRYGHEDIPYEEGLRIPLIIHAPGRFGGGERVRGPSNLTDILPTVLDLLGYELRGGDYPGYSLLRQPPEDRTLRFSCFNEGKCLASLGGYIKYVHHYDDRPDELFDLSADPLERHDLAEERPAEARKRREDLLAWYLEANAAYGGSPEKPENRR